MPNFIKSGKYYYKVNKRDGNKIRISKEEFNKHKKYKVKNKITKINKNKELNINNLIKNKIKKIDKSKILNSILGINFNTVKNGKTYEIYARLGRCPRTGYYIYNVNAISMSNNNMKEEIYSRSMMSSDKNILNKLL